MKTKYYIRVYWGDEISPTIYEDVDRYLIQSGNWFVIKWDDLGTTTLLNIDTARQIIVEEMDTDHE